MGVAAPPTGATGPGSPPGPAFDAVPGASGLYVLPPVSPGEGTGVYFLTAAAQSPAPPRLYLADSWNAEDGWYLFTEGPIPLAQAAAFAKSARVNLPGLVLGGGPSSQASGHAIVWVTAAEIARPATLGAAQAIILTFTGVAWTLRNAKAFRWPPLTVTLSQNAPVTLDTGGPALVITLLAGFTGYITVAYDGMGAAYAQNPPTWEMTIPLGGPQTGAMTFPIALDVSAMTEALGCEIRYFYGPGGQALICPFIPYATPSGQNVCAFDISLHPLFPLNPALSRFTLDFTGQSGGSYAQYSANAAALACPYLFATDGSEIEVQPLSAYAPPAGAAPPGFAFCLGGGTAAAPTYYLAPAGTYTVRPVASPAPASFDLMPGLFEREYLRLDLGDLLHFVPGQPALAAGFGGGSPGGQHVGGSPNAPGLTGPLTTSWVEVLPQGSGASRGFFSQPSASPYFSDVGEAYPGAVDAFLGDLAAPPPAPIALYGGVGVAPVSPAPDPDVFAQFEAQVLAAERHELLTTVTSGPMIVDPRVHSQLAMGLVASPPPAPPTAVTPQGMVVELTPEGLWSSIVVGIQPAGEASPQAELRFDGAGSPPLAMPALTGLLTRNELFLVISRLDPHWPFQNRIFVGGFEFVLDVPIDASPLDDGTILVFKYNSKVALQDLVAQPELWSGASTFNHDVQATSADLMDAIATAKSEADAPGKPFSYFEQIATDPTWTGLIAFNARIDGSAMPLDLQMLLGGINGQLRAHHFGVQSNHLERVGDPARTEITQSSLFGVIFYENLQAPAASPTPSPAVGPTFDYEVETLIVVFENSAITLFDVEIGMTINALFGREVALAGPPTSPGVPANTLRIKGQYQDRGGIGTVTFVSDSLSVFAFPVTETTGPRVLDKLIVEQASLVPVAGSGGSPGKGHVGAPGTTTVSANFAISGDLWFNPSPFPNSDSLDLFSYGTATGGGLGFSGLSISIAFVLGPDGAMEPGSKTLTFHPELMQPAPSTDAIRPDSLMYSLPLQFSRFLTNPKGLTQSATGATPVHVLELETGALTASPHASPALTPAGQTSPWSTTSPTFALEYDISLGSLGSLSSVHGDISAKLILGWGPSPTIPDADAAAVMVQLPQLSAGYQGFNLQGLLKTTFGDANLLKVELDHGAIVYAMVLNNIQFSVFGYTFPPGVMADFLLFAGASGDGDAKPYASNLAWYLAVTEKAS